MEKILICRRNDLSPSVIGDNDDLVSRVAFIKNGVRHVKERLLLYTESLYIVNISNGKVLEQ
jgi:hypothetical protein